MRQFLFTICTFITFTYCNSTHNISNTFGANYDKVLAGQLQEVINVIPKEFEIFKGKELSNYEGVTVYSSTLTLHETSANIIEDLGGRPCYTAKIAEKKTEEQAMQLVENWITKVGTCIGTSVLQQTHYRRGGTKSELQDGTVFFVDKNHGVKVYWSKEPNAEIYNVMITVV